MPMIDVFGTPEFSMANLTTAINALPYKPKLLGSMGVFQETPINTTVAKVEKREGKLSLLNTAGRGTVKDVRSQPDRVVRTFGLPHVPQFQTIMADDIKTSVRLVLRLNLKLSTMLLMIISKECETITKQLMSIIELVPLKD